MDIENVLYIIIGIGWFLWNAYRKTKQEKPKGAPRRNQQPTPSSTDQPSADPFRTLEDIILEQLEGETEAKPAPVPVAVEPRHKNQDKFLSVDLDHSHLLDDYQMSVGESGSHRVQRQVTPLKTEQMEPELSVMDELFPDGFELRKAVVLNAILERPYA